MMRALYAGVSGLQNHQLRMDVVADNIANANTAGFKASRVTFAETMAQTLRGAGAPQRGIGGTNPLQVGLGVQTVAIDTVATRGSAEMTGVGTDLSIEGEGYFIVEGPGGRFYTRAGAFRFDAQGNLVNPDGFRVLGWIADSRGNIAQGVGDLKPLQVQLNQVLPGQASTAIDVLGNLDARSKPGDTFTMSVAVTDSLGAAHVLLVEFTAGANPGEWDVTVKDGGGNVLAQSANPLTFDSSGVPTANTTLTFTFNPPGGAAAMNLKLDLGSLRQMAMATDLFGRSDGYGPGQLTAVTIDHGGTIRGSFSNGRTAVLGQIALALFANPAGLERQGGSLFAETANSGRADIGAPVTGGRGGILPGTLEMSNVDLAREFTTMITTERGFQANARVITVADEMLHELANLKR